MKKRLFSGPVIHAILHDRRTQALQPQLFPRSKAAGGRAEPRAGDWTLSFDGLCEPRNPGGVIAWGWLITSGEEAAGPILEGHGSRPAEASHTNNQAEWFALGFALKAVKDLIAARGRPGHLVIQGDSKLVVCQLLGTWACGANPLLAVCRTRCLAILESIDPLPGWWDARWIPREQNTSADELSRRAYRELTGREAPQRRAKAGRS